ncbi:MAG: hypothetical protein L0229_22125 [Blastocatellia bacterium]|nr:hypothetical protein [Blastocatellia bacterium]
MANMIYKTGSSVASDPGDGSDLESSRLESIYNKYGGRIYSLCLRLLADETAAEDATAEAFVRFHKEAESQLDEAEIFPRLLHLGVEASLQKLRVRGGWICRLLRLFS